MRDDLQAFLTACQDAEKELGETSTKLRAEFKKLPDAERNIIFDFIGEAQYYIDESRNRLLAAIEKLREMK